MNVVLEKKLLCTVLFLIVVHIDVRRDVTYFAVSGDMCVRLPRQFFRDILHCFTCVVFDGKFLALLCHRHLHSSDTGIYFKRGFKQLN